MLTFRIIDPQSLVPILGDDFFENGFVRNYMNSNPCILDRVDIFCENEHRSGNQIYKAFNLFKEVSESPDYLVCSIYLELLEYAGLRDRIRTVVEYVAKTFPNDRVIYQWNHDTDFAQHFGWFADFPKAFVVQFNTSRPNPNDIVVPFWNINTKPYLEPKRLFAGFFGNLNNSPIRTNLAREIQGKPGYGVINTGTNRKYPETEFLKLISSTCWTFCPRGAGLSSYRFFEALHAGTVPVLMADAVTLPYIDRVDYEKICVRLPEDAQFPQIDRTLRSLDDRVFLQEIAKVRELFSLRGVQELIHERLSQ